MSQYNFLEGGDMDFPETPLRFKSEILEKLLDGLREQELNKRGASGLK